MSGRIDTRELRRRLSDPAELCNLLGLRGQRQARGLLVCCPAHEERHPSCSVTSGPDGTLRWRCFACGASGDALGLVAAIRGLDCRRDFGEVVRHAAELAGFALADDRPLQPRRSPPPAPPPAPEPEPVPSVAAFDALCGVLATLGRLDDGPLARDVTGYLERRHLLAEARADAWFALPPEPQQAGLVAWLAELADHGAEDVAPEHAPGWTRTDLAALGWLPRLPHGAARLCIPWRVLSGRRVLTVQRRRIEGGEPRYIFPRGRPPRWPYGVERLRQGVPVALVEGAIDALAYRALCRAHGIDRDVLGLPGVSGWRDEWGELLRGREVLLALDADSAGERAAVKLAELARQAGAVSVARRTAAGGGDWADSWARFATGRAA